MPTKKADEKVAQEELPEWMTREKPNLATRLRRIMADPDARYLHKAAEAGGGEGEYGFAYNPHAQVSSMIQPLLWKHGVLLLSETENVSYETYGSGRDTKLHTRVGLKMTFVNCDDLEDKYELHWDSNSVNKGDKGLFSAISSGIRIFITKQFHIPSGEMDIEEYDVKIGSTPLQTVRTVPAQEANGTEEPAPGYKDAIALLMNRWKVPKGKAERGKVLAWIAEDLKIATPETDGEWDKASLRAIHDHIEKQVLTGQTYSG